MLLSEHAAQGKVRGSVGDEVGDQAGKWWGERIVNDGVPVGWGEDVAS